MLLRDLFRVAQVIDGRMGNDDEIDLLELIGLHRVAGTIVEERIDEDAAAIGMDQFVGGDAKEASRRGFMRAASD